MNEKLVGWFEDILPEIKETNDVRGTMLKFANEKNMAPALLEKLGHVYNTAKTVTYLDKCASQNKGRGETFDVLDIPSLIEEYTEKKASDHEFSNNNFSSLSSGRFTDLFEGKVTFDDLNSLQESDDYKEVKIASDQRLAWKKDSIKIANVTQAEQLIFDAKEDNRKVASEISDYIRDSYNETSFEAIEQDAKYYFGDCVKSACDYVASYMEGINYSVKRASDSGKPRLITDNTFLLKFAFIQDNLNTQEQAEDFVADHTPKKKETEKLANSKYPLSQDEYQALQDRKLKAEVEKKEKELTRLDEEEETLAVEDTTAGGTDNNLDALKEDFTLPAELGIKGVKKMYSGATDVLGSARKSLGLDKNIPDTVSSIRDTLTNFVEDIAPGKNEGQALIDRELDEAKYTSVLQDLIITDPILSEEDEDKVVDLYNTIKSVAPEMAKDKNVARVILRSAVQYDGIAAPDLAQLVEAERSIQRSRANASALESSKYDRTPDRNHRIN
tara:strand:- start:2130 stop:3632 length:1503 start_codon:yes stop_codon:yes gene_type:complete